MRFSISSAELKEKLQIISGAIDSNPILPILEDFLFQIEGETLTIVASNNKTFMTAELSVQSNESGSVAIPAKILLDTLKQLPSQQITFAINLETFAVTITSAFGQYNVAGEDGNDYPKLPIPEAVETVDMPASMLLDAVNKTLFATSNDDLRPTMTGVFFEASPEGLTFVATDAHKLVKYTFNDLDIKVDTQFIVPKKALQLLKNALVNNSQELRLSFSETNAFFYFNNQVLVCRLIEGRYPDYNAVIPENNPNLMSITRTDFLHSLKRISNYTNKTTNQVKLSISDGSLTIEGEDLDFANKATEQLPCFFEGEPIEIGFNAKFLIEMLNSIGGDSIRLELSSPKRAGILRAEESEPNEDLLMLVMPVMIHV